MQRGTFVAAGAVTCVLYRLSDRRLHGHDRRNDSEEDGDGECVWCKAGFGCGFFVHYSVSFKDPACRGASTLVMDLDSVDRTDQDQQCRVRVCALGQIDWGAYDPEQSDGIFVVCAAFYIKGDSDGMERRILMHYGNSRGASGGVLYPDGTGEAIGSLRGDKIVSI